jgi:flagellar biosynthesis protein FlhA
VRDLETVLETVSEWGSKTKDIEVLTEYVRNAMRRGICQQYTSPGDNGSPRLVCVTLDPTLEDQISGFIDRGPAGTTVNMPARIANRVADQIVRGLASVIDAGLPPVVIASPPVRAVVRQIVEPHLASIAVLGYNEIVSGIEVESRALVMPPQEKAAA